MSLTLLKRPLCSFFIVSIFLLRTFTFTFVLSICLYFKDDFIIAVLKALSGNSNMWLILRLECNDCLDFIVCVYIYTHTYTHTPHLFIHSSVDGRLVDFLISVIVNNGVINIGGAYFFLISVFVFFR